jgi:signal peptidase I
MKTFGREILITVLIAVIAFFTLHASIQSCVVVGPSMEPTVEEKQRLLINKLVYFLHGPQRGDIIVFQPPNKQQPDYIKRLIGLPGDTIEIKSGYVYINGKKLEEPYTKSLPNYNLSAMRLPDDHYFVLGDNRNNSNDSHNGWTIQKEDIVGKAWLSIWPPDNWGVLQNGHIDGQLAWAWSIQPLD